MKNWKFLQLTKLKSKDQAVKGHNPETKFILRIFGSLLVALSGFILFIDKVTKGFHLENNFGYDDTETFIWVISQTLSPLILITASVFKPYKTSYLIPIYIYAIQLYWVFESNALLDNGYLHIYATGFCLSFLLLSYVVFKINSLKNKRKIENENFQKDVTETIELLKKDILTNVE
ncbi:hypothetical protein [Tenacibaculum sp. SDUM215027]|uniref:hypothetical protein n=1 Tax=Tenacibaculum sp. SDUM215027 TaxID=3422596 RepID=UPI003D319A5D